MIREIANGLLAIALVCVILVGGFYLGLYAGRKEATVYLDPSIRLPSIEEWQQMLNDQHGAKLVIDGELGRKTEAEWNNAYNNQCAKETWPKD